MSREEHLREIQKLLFYTLDLNLYLDNFPECDKATKDYDHYSRELKRLIWEYEKNHGPLTNYGSAYFQNPKDWVNSPWPWENKKGGNK